MSAALTQLPLRAAERPNIILTMTDDQGWGDVSYNGNPVLKTPHLDEMSGSGVRFDRFYAAYPVCSPTRASVMTGRHPCRYGCFSWGYDLPLREVTVAEALKPAGYATGHFGKWHLGGIPYAPGTTNRGRMPGPDDRHPNNQGFEEYFSHGNWFDLNPDKLYHNGKAAGRIEGDTSDIVMDRALEFIRKAKRPFLAVIWFPSPHGPHQALEKDRAPYLGKPGNADFYGEMAGVDRNIGRLRAELRKLGIHRDTMLWFNSDNGAIPAGSTGGLSGAKGNLMEGGIRVPAILEWPGRIAKPFTTKVPCGTVDLYPTILAALGVRAAGQMEPLDGISLLPLIDGGMKRRPKPLAFQVRDAKGTVTSAALIDNEFKYYRGPAWSGRIQVKGEGPREHLYNLDADAAETQDLSTKQPEVFARLRNEWSAWNRSVERDLEAYPFHKS